ncbi:MAG: HAD-IA family hydrolase [Pseudomonadota bacterium]
MIRVLSFDLDDTLWAVKPVILRAERVQWAWIREHFPQSVGVLDKAKLQELRRNVWDAYPDLHFDLTFLRLECLRRIAALSGIQDAAGFATDAFAAFESARNRVCFFPDALPALARLARDYPLVAVTNGNASLDRTGIGSWFSARVSARDVGAAKPDSRMFDAAAKLATVAPDEVLHIGDSPELDVEGARQAGQHTVWLNRHGMAWPENLLLPDFEIRSLAELTRRTIAEIGT